jgi:hypothetical protein
VRNLPYGERDDERGLREGYILHSHIEARHLRVAELKWWNNKNFLVGKKLDFWTEFNSYGRSEIVYKADVPIHLRLSSETSRETRSILFRPCPSLKSQLRSQLTSQPRRKIQILLQVLTAEPTVEPPTQAPTVPPSKNPCLLSKWAANLMLAKEPKTSSTGKPKTCRIQLWALQIGARNTVLTCLSSVPLSKDSMEAPYL